MNNFSIQNLTLMMMMLIVLVNTLRAPSPEEKLREIGRDAKNLFNKVTENIDVEKIPIGLVTCVPKFFCFAEKILRHATNVTNAQQCHGQKKLIAHLEVYNNMINDSCRLTTNHHQDLKGFLKEIQICVDYYTSHTE